MVPILVADQARDRVTIASKRLDEWIEREQFKGWDPFDALNSPLLKRLTLKSRRLGQLWVQFFKRSPINLRPLLGLKQDYNPKAMGLFLASYWRKYITSGQLSDLNRVRFFTEWLRANISSGYSGACWGYNFDWPNRGFYATAGTPTIVNTDFNGRAFLDLALIEPDWASEWSDLPLRMARSACEFILRDLHREKPVHDECCFSYTPLDHRYVHNANVLGALLLAKVGVQTHEDELMTIARNAARYTTRRQRSNGSWLYGEGKGDGWIDNFHTGYVLVALNGIAKCLATNEFAEEIQCGYAFWKEQMFLSDGTPKYYAQSVYPIDTHCAAFGILMFLEFADWDLEATERAWRLAQWAIEHLQDPQGFFHYQIGRVFRIRIPYMRWTQAWMQRALTELEWHTFENLA